MAAPWISGASGTDIYISRDIDIVKEYLSITLIDIYTAEIDVRYIISTDDRKERVPFIFDTMSDNSKYSSDNYDFNDFKVWLDNSEIGTADIQHVYYDKEAKEKLIKELRHSFVDIQNLSAFKYFILDLETGTHEIRVKYNIIATVDLWRNIRKYVFAYNLKPAKYWKSYGGLELTVDVSGIDEQVTINLPDSEPFKGIKQWYFTDIPQDELYISCNPHISPPAELFISLSSEGLSFLLILILVVIHILMIYKYRRVNNRKRFPAVVVLGCLLLPLVLCFLLVYTNYFIDWVIGDHASGRHGYIFLVFFLYPVFLIIYSLTIFIIDQVIKRHFIKTER